MAKVLQMPRRMVCPKCGVDAACDCGVKPVPAHIRAAQAIKTSPNKSNRAIAEQIGVHHSTVNQARKKSTGGNPPVRVGRDGKARRLPNRPPAPISSPTNEINGFHRELLGFLTGFSERFTAWHDSAPLLDPVSKAELRQAFYLCSDGLYRLAQKLD